MRRRTAKRSLDGTVHYYRDWLADVRRLADERGLPESVRELATDPMLYDAWEKNETPAHFLDSLPELAGGK